MATTIAPGVYKIVSVVDSNCLDCEGGGGKKKTKVISWHYAGGDNQKFQIHNEGTGFRIANLVKGKDNMMLVIEHSEKQKGIVIMEFNGDPSQQWQFVPASKYPGKTVLIKNAKSGLCLRNMGHGNPIESIPESTDDKSQHWNLVSVDE